MNSWTIQQLHTTQDQVDIIKLRVALWPHMSEDEHRREVAKFISRDDIYFFLARADDGRACGFAEVSLREHANGCEFSPLLFLEGIWIDIEHRRGGLGRELIKNLEQFALDNNIPGLASDCLVENEASQKAHAAWGFKEVERVVCYAKPLLRE